MRKKLVFELDNLAFPIKVYQTSKDRFIVQYGEEIGKGLNLGDCADQLGRSIMHALSCDGKIVN